MIGVIADDLTGAAELGAVGLRHGLRAEIVVKGGISGNADLVCVDTDSRSCSPEEAGRRAAAAANLLRTSGAQWIYKKVDSVLRGPVAAELQAIMKELCLQLALLLPANPSLGRVIRGGRYYVRGKPINETEFARDPEHPRASADVRELLGATGSLPTHVRNSRDPLPASGIVIGEAQTAGDVQQWAARRSSEMLLAGGAEFFGALLAATGPALSPVRAEPATPPATSRELFVCGSTSESAREFVTAARARGTPVFSLPAELTQGADFTPAVCETIARQAVTALRSHRRVILNVGLPSVRERPVAKLLAIHLVQLAKAVLLQAEVGHVYAEGGATAVELVRRMGWARLAVLRELAPGVATLAVEGGQSLWLTIKPGSYEWPNEVRT